MSIYGQDEYGQQAYGGSAFAIHIVGVSESLALTENLDSNPFQIICTSGTTLQVFFPADLRFDNIRDITNYLIRPLGSGVPVRVVAVEPQYTVFQTGSEGRALDLGRTDFLSNQFRVDGALDASDIGDYIEILSGLNTNLYRIDSVESSTDAVLSLDLVLKDPENGYFDSKSTILNVGTKTLQLTEPRLSALNPVVEVLLVRNRTTGDSFEPSGGDVTIDAYNVITITTGFSVSAGDDIVFQARVAPIVEWQHSTGVTGVILTTTKMTGGADYHLSIDNLLTKITGTRFTLESDYEAPVATVAKPRVDSASYDAVEGKLVLHYDQPMRVDSANLTNVVDYTITGPTTVTIRAVKSVDESTVAIETQGITDGSYTLNVSTSTPKDVAGNPLDPIFNTVIFTGSSPENIRSVFTDKGPIAKPPLTLMSGSGATLNTYNEVTLTGATLTGASLGMFVSLTGGSLNGGVFRITSIITSTRAKLANASFSFPDPDSGTLTWEVFDPRDGQIADDPDDVVVRINDVPTTPLAVVGLLGQVVLDTIPDPDDTVDIDYSWVCNPTVELRRLNSREFRLNNFNRDTGNLSNAHRYRYNNVTITPSLYEPDNMSATLDQPVERELHYRAYERAYTPVLNDPTLLLLNSPIHRISYPKVTRVLTETSVGYEGLELPEANSSPWTRKGSGSATVSAGQLEVIDSTGGTYPSGKGLFWTKSLDLTFPHVFAMSWRSSVTSTPELDGVFTGVAAGYSNDQVVLLVGSLDDSGTKKLGILKRGSADRPYLLSSWIGGLDVDDNPTLAPQEVDWSVLHSYRVFKDTGDIVRVYLDGDIEPILQCSLDDLPYLEEVAAPFNELQGAFFGALSRPAKSTSSWDFVRYLILPNSPLQSSASSFVSYEANVTPEQDPLKPWTPIGFHGSTTILDTDTLLLDSWSATDQATADDVELVGGDFLAFTRLEPLLTVSSSVVLDADIQFRTSTNGISPYGLTMAVDDGSRLMQLAFFPDVATPKLSYGGRSFPEDFSPYTWQAIGGATATMRGRTLEIDDDQVGDGLVYFIEDQEASVSDDRVVHSTIDYILEFRCRVISYTVDGDGFAGAFAQVYDSARSVGVLLRDDSGTLYVSMHSDGVLIGSEFEFDWADGEPHTYRLSKSTGGNTVSLFIDGEFIGVTDYSDFSVPVADPDGQISFGSSTPASTAALSVVEWFYVNAWRLRSDLRYYVGLWKGEDEDSLLGYHLPTKFVGQNATANGNALGDTSADFIADNVLAGDMLVVDAGINRGVYEIAAVGSANSLTIVGTWTASVALINYRIVQETDILTAHKYRLTRDSTGEVAVLIDSESTPLIRVGYNSLDLPPSGVGKVRTLSNGLPAILFGSIDSENLSQSSWGFVRYGIVRSLTEQGIAPHHQVLNQWNVMSSPERLFTALPHELTSFKSSSTGIVPKKDPDFLADSGLVAFTRLNESTPLVPRTQTFEVRAPFPTQEFVSQLNNPEDVLNTDGDFTLNDGTIRYRLIVPDDVLYNSLDVIEQTDGGVTDLIAPADDDCQPMAMEFNYTNEVCLTYDADTIPELDTSAATPWELVSDNPAEVSATTFSGILTYGTGAVGTTTVYRNNSPLPDSPSLQTEVSFRIKLLADSTLGTGDSQVRFGLSAPGMTIALAFVTTPLGERVVKILDLNSGLPVGGISFDFLDGAYHTYRILRNPGAGVVQVFVD